MTKAKAKAKVKFAFTPYPLQQDIINHLDGIVRNAQDEPYRFFVVAIGRQAGKSWLAKYTLLDRAINRQQQCVWVAPSIPTARSHWDDLVSMVEKSGIPTKKISQAGKQIIFADGGQISVRSAVEPDNMRGLTVDYVVMDEAAFFRNGEYVWYSIVLPMVTASRGVVLFTSTPNGRNYFWQLYLQGNKPDSTLYKSWHAPSTVSPYQDRDLLEVIRQSMPEYQYKEEFEAEFLADGTGVFSGADQAAVVEMLNAPLEGHEYVAGIDFGFNTDATTFTVIDKYTGEQVFGKRFYNYGTAGTIRSLVALMRVWKPTVTHLEKNGVGESLFQIMKAVLNGDEEIPDVLSVVAPVENGERYFKDGTKLDDSDQHALHEWLMENDPAFGGSAADEEDYDKNYLTDWGGRIKAIHMDNKIKRSLVEKLAADIEYKRLKILKGEAGSGSYGETQLNEMSTYQRERTQSGLDITYNAAEGSHDDTVSGLYLANKGVPRRKSMKKSIETDKPPAKNPFRGSSRSHLRGRHNAKRN